MKMIAVPTIAGNALTQFPLQVYLARNFFFECVGSLTCNSVYFSLFIRHKGYKREKKINKSLAVYNLMARKPKRSQQAYREWAPSNK